MGRWIRRTDFTNCRQRKGNGVYTEDIEQWICGMKTAFGVEMHKRFQCNLTKVGAPILNDRASARNKPIPTHIY